MQQNTRTRRQKAQETRHSIFTVAMELFKEKGYENVTVEEITKKANISVGGFYHHFKCKEELVFEWADQLDLVYQKFHDETVVHVHSGNLLEVILQKFLLVMEQCADWGKDFITINYTYMMKNQTFNERMIGRDRICNAIMWELFSKGQEWNLIRRDIPIENLVRDSVKLERGALIAWCIQGGTENILEENKFYFQTFIDGIRSK